MRQKHEFSLLVDVAFGLGSRGGTVHEFIESLQPDVGRFAHLSAAVDAALTKAENRFLHRIPRKTSVIYRTYSAPLPSDPDAPNIAVLPNHVTMPIGVAIVESQVEFVR